MGRQFRHDSASIGAPCGRCGLVYSPKTAYVPCFEEGDTFESWRARQPEELRPTLQPPVGVVRPRDIFVDGSVSALEEARGSLVQALLGLTTTSRLRSRAAASEVVTAMSTLLAAHIRDATSAWAHAEDDLAAVVADRDRLAARVAELEAELARRGPEC